MTTDGRKFLFAAAGLQADTFKAIMRYQTETLSFLKRRCEQNIKLVDDLFAGDEFADAFDVVSNFVQNATSDYAVEIGNLATAGSKLTSEIARRVRREAEGTVQDMAASTVA